MYFLGSVLQVDPGRREQASPLDAGLSHVAGHQLEPLLQMFGEFRLRPVEVHHKHLQGIQLPEQIFRGGRPVTAGMITETVSNRKSQTRMTPLPLDMKHYCLE